MTDVERWHRVEAIFHEVADLPAGPSRDARVVELSDGDQTLVDELRALLAQDDALHESAAAVDPHLGLRLGAYRIDALAARGGMAAVYVAHRADDAFQQRVAIKIMDLRLSDPDLVMQFAAERQILASFEHPALTRLLDGGVTTLGEPYLVMEFVDGVVLDRYCDAHRLDLRDRLRLFLEVCDGVSFAHRNLILHRDLKPSNILVTADGHAKVVDFGTATLLQPDRLSTTSVAPLTPAYASPEQLTGRPVGTASDQYSLGLVLYELLAGASAFPHDASLMASMERALTGTGPTLPHTVVTADAAAARQVSLSRLRRQLSGDLGTIVRKALAADPAQRYSSVQHLADDLVRWMAGEPVLGRAPSVVYRVTRFVQRHAIAATLVAVLFLGLVATTVQSRRQAVLAREQALIATNESTKARQLNQFLTRMFTAANPSFVNANAATAGSVTVRQVLDGASGLIAAELADAPAVEAELRRTLGRTYNGLGASEQAMPQLQRALALYREQHDAFGEAFTQYQIGETHILRGAFADGETALRQALAYVRAQGDACDPELRIVTAGFLGNAILYRSPGDAEGLALYREAVDTSDRTGANKFVATVFLQNLGAQYLRMGRLDDAETTLRDAQRRFDAVGSDSPERYALLRSLATVELQRGRYVEAERLAADAVAGTKRLRPPDHPLLPNFLSWWGRALVAAGQVERGRDVLIEAVTAYRKIRPPDHLELGLPLISLGVAYRLEGRLNDSEQALRQAQLVARSNPKQRDRGADMAGELGLTLRALGRTAEAETLLRESRDTLLEIFGPGHPLTAQAEARLGGATH